MQSFWTAAVCNDRPCLLSQHKFTVCFCSCVCAVHHVIFSPVRLSELFYPAILAFLAFRHFYVIIVAAHSQQHSRYVTGVQRFHPDHSDNIGLEQEAHSLFYL